MKPTFLFIIFNYLFSFIWTYALTFSNPATFFSTLNHRQKRYVTYPSGTAIGLLVAIAVPIDVPEENLYFSLNFEANYNLPDNITQYYNSDFARMLNSITRKTTYHLIESSLEKQGYNSEECLLRLVCETSQFHFPAYGLIESIFDVIFRPSSSFNDDLLEKYERAELMGLNSSNCSKLYLKCDLSLLDLLTVQ